MMFYLHLLELIFVDLFSNLSNVSDISSDIFVEYSVKQWQLNLLKLNQCFHLTQKRKDTDQTLPKFAGTE